MLKEIRWSTQHSGIGPKEDHREFDLVLQAKRAILQHDLAGLQEPSTRYSKSRSSRGPAPG